MLIDLQVIDSQFISFLSTRSHGYESPKELHLENQALTTHFNKRY